MVRGRNIAHGPIPEFGLLVASQDCIGCDSRHGRLCTTNILSMSSLFRYVCRTADIIGGD